MLASTELEPSDEQLVEEYWRSSQERRRALADELFTRHYQTVARWCYRFSGDPESAADLAQEVFLKAHRHLDSFQGTSRFSTWLYAIARNEYLNRLRKRPPVEIQSDDGLGDLPALEPGPEEIATSSSRARRLHDLLATTLDETERTVFTLHYGDDMPLDSITRALNLMNASGAKAYIVSARRKLARATQRLAARGERL
ncbi:MAG TPA: sigma-70 family RNA polymerase sigma factor [Thermoanaerobaculia bacterium]|nr:sigma-70 family RNA polymerase sigma factor [Thermoanaerobaculia bacterium]